MSSLTPEMERNRMCDEAFALRRAVAVLVEGKSDKVFWQRVFEEAEVQGGVHIWAETNYPTPGTSGSNAIRRHFAPLVKSDFRVCLDSEYTYVLGQQATRQPFVYYTYLHSVENFYADPIHIEQVLALGLQVTDSFPEVTSFTDRYAQACYPLFTVQLETGAYDMSPFNLMRKPGKRIFETLLNDFEGQVNTQTATSSFIDGLRSRGLSPERTHLFLQGHFVFDIWVLHLLQYLSSPIIKSKMASMSAHERTAFTDYMAGNRFETLLQSQCAYAHLPEYQRIISDVSSDNA
jgi:Protein of unknown function (DUF4435)